MTHIPCKLIYRLLKMNENCFFFFFADTLVTSYKKNHNIYITTYSHIWIKGLLQIKE